MLDPFPTISLSNFLPNVKFIVHIINICFSTGNFHDKLKSAVVQPLTKKNCDLDPNAILCIIQIIFPVKKILFRHEGFWKEISYNHLFCDLHSTISNEEAFLQNLSNSEVNFEDKLPWYYLHNNMFSMFKFLITQ